MSLIQKAVVAVLAGACLGLLVSCSTMSRLEKWELPVAKAESLLNKVATKAAYYKQRIHELDKNADGKLDIWELLSGLMVLKEKLE